MLVHHKYPRYQNWDPNWDECEVFGDKTYKTIYVYCIYIGYPMYGYSLSDLVIYDDSHSYKWI